MPPGVAGCFPTPGPSKSLNISLYWPPALLTDLVLFTLTICKVFPIWQGSNRNSRLSWIVLRDEILVRLTPSSSVFLLAHSAHLDTVLWSDLDSHCRYKYLDVRVPLLPPSTAKAHSCSPGTGIRRISVKVQWSLPLRSRCLVSCGKTLLVLPVNALGPKSKTTLLNLKFITSPS